MNKIRYPATVFQLLKKYPLKYCRYCGLKLTPRLETVKGKVKLEKPGAFHARETCNRTCSGALRRQRNVKEPQITVPPPVVVGVEPSKPLGPELQATLIKTFTQHPDLLEVWHDR